MRSPSKMTAEEFAYRDQMRMVAWPLRLGGLIAIMAGCGVLIGFRYSLIGWLMVPGFLLIGVGWGVYGYAIWKRTQWAKANPFRGSK